MGLTWTTVLTVPIGLILASVFSAIVVYAQELMPSRVGMAAGQVVYGPLLDRFGRKPSPTAGLVLFVVASLGCAFAPDVYTLIALRFAQALGGCVAQVGSVAMARDFFPRDQAAPTPFKAPLDSLVRRSKIWDSCRPRPGRPKEGRNGSRTIIPQGPTKPNQTGRFLD